MNTPTATLITIGDEILIGQIVDTNSAFIAKELNLIGVSVYEIISAQDEKNHIRKALKQAEQQSEIVVLTGGLGATKDDITKETFCDYFQDQLVFNDDIFRHIQELFRKIELRVNSLTKKQAEVPSKAHILTNDYGTAPGMLMEKNGVLFFSLPGIPLEMKPLMKNKVIPILKEKFQLPTILNKTVLVTGIPESILAEQLTEWESSLPSFIKLAYLPSLGRIRLRLTAKGNNKNDLQQRINEKISDLKSILKTHLKEHFETEPEEILGTLLKQRNQTVATAESCTGGSIAKKITSIAGSSSYYKGSMITYATESKINLLNVSTTTIQEYTVVSKEVAEQMAINVKKALQVDFSIAVTGVAGPKKGKDGKEVGTVWIAVAAPQKVFSQCFQFGKRNRQYIIEKASSEAIILLCDYLISDSN